MSDYLQQLEKLGALHATGVLSDTEFETEKARILAARVPVGREELVANLPWWRSKQSALLVGLVAILGTGAYFGAHAIERNQADATESLNRAVEPARGTVHDSGMLALDKDCTPNNTLTTIVRRIREAGLSTNSNERVVQLSNARSADVSQSNLKVGEIQVQSAAATIEVVLNGLNLLTITTLDWPNGEGVRFTFSNSPEEARGALSRTGVLTDASAASGKRDVFITSLPRGAALTCLKSTQVMMPTSSAGSEELQ